MNKKVLAIVAVIALVALLGVCLVACNASDYKKRLDNAGYHTEVLEGEAAKEEADGASVEWVVIGSKGFSEHVSVIKFKSTDDAKEFEMNMPEFGVGGISIVCERSGKIVIYGTEQAVKDAK